MFNRLHIFFGFSTFQLKLNQRKTALSFHWGNQISKCYPLVDTNSAYSQVDSWDVYMDLYLVLKRDPKKLNMTPTNFDLSVSLV